MGKVWLIVKREYITRVKTRGLCLAPSRCPSSASVSWCFRFFSRRG